MLEKHRCRAVHQRAAESFTSADDIDEPTLVKRLQHAANADAANLFDFGAADRLSIRDDRECLEGGCGESLWARRELRAFDGFRVFGAREYLPATADFLQLDAVSVYVVMLAELVDRGRNRRRRIVGR